MAQQQQQEEGMIHPHRSKGPIRRLQQRVAAGQGRQHCLRIYNAENVDRPSLQYT
jgi:hypothetical protein